MSKQFAGPTKKSICTSQISHWHIQGDHDRKRHLVLILVSEPVISQSHQVNVGSILYRVIILSERYQLPPGFWCKCHTNGAHSSDCPRTWQNSGRGWQMWLSNKWGKFEGASYYSLCEPEFSSIIHTRGKGSVVSWYNDWLRAGRSRDRILVGARFSEPVQTGPGAHPASCTMGTRSFPGVKSGRDETLTPHPLLVPLVMKD